MKKIGAEVILTVILLPFLIWIVTNIFSLQASTGNTEENIKEIKEDLRFIREYLIEKK